MKKTDNTVISIRHRRGIGQSLLFCLLLLLPLLTSLADEAEQSGPGKAITNPNPGTDLWRAVRLSSTKGSSQVNTVDGQVLINDLGMRWQSFRMTQLIPYGAYFMAGTLVIILLFFLIRGRVLLPDGESGKSIPRSSVALRITHWFLATLFIILAFTGVALLLGRALLIPLLGQETFAMVAAASKEIHNLFGPIFPIAVLGLLFLLFKANLYEKGDLVWLARGGGLLGGHVSAGRYNFGEKIWFWIVIIVGITISVSGLILDFPVFGQSRFVMELSQLVHAIAAILIIVFAFGHIYLATIGVEGSLQAMTKGEVDANWAKIHHDRWYEESEKNQG